MQVESSFCLNVSIIYLSEDHSQQHGLRRCSAVVCVCLVAGEVMDRAIQVAEPYTAIRLVSSGWSYNSVTVRYQKLAVADYDL